MDQIKFLLAKVFDWDLVWTEDHDGFCRLRRVYTTPFGKRFVYGSTSQSRFELDEGGKIKTYGYVIKWLKAN